MLDALRPALARSGFLASIYMESLDELRFAIDERSVALETHILSGRFSSIPFDIILAEGGGAPLQLALRYRRANGLRIPVYAFNIVEPDAGARNATEADLYVRFLPDPLLPTFALARELLPDARRAILVAQPSKLADGHFRAIVEELRAQDRAMEIELVEAGDESVRAAFAKAGEGSFAILLTPGWPRAGGMMGGQGLAAELDARYKLPTFGIFNELFGSALIGGCFVDEGALGEGAAAMIGEILAAKERPEPEGVESSSRAVLDYRALLAFSIPGRRIPAGARVLFAPPPFWLRYQVPLQIAGLFLVFAIVVLSAYAAMRRHDRETLRKSNASLELQVAERTAEYEASNRNLAESLMRIEAMQERLIGETREVVLGRLALSLAHEINNPLAAIRASNDAVSAVLAPDSGGFASRLISLDEDERALFAALLEKPAPRPLGLEGPGAEENRRLAARLRGLGIDDERALADEIADTGLEGLSDEELLELCSARGRAVMEALAYGAAIRRAAAIGDQAAMRIAETVEAIRSYAREGALSAAREKLDLAASLDRALLLFREREEEGIAVIKDYGPEPLTVMAEGSALVRLWTNLLENSFRSVRSREGVAAKAELRLGIRRDGDEAIVEIGDSGPVLPPEQRAELFEPFSASAGPETGLSLALCKRIAEGLGGGIEYDPSGGASLFRLRLPLASA